MRTHADFPDKRRLAGPCGCEFRPAVDSRTSVPKVREKVRRCIRVGMTPIEIARKLHLPLLLIAEIIAWEATIRQAGGQGLDA